LKVSCLADQVAVRFFFIAGLLFLSASKYVDNLVAYSASRPETSLLISSVFVNRRVSGNAERDSRFVEDAVKQDQKAFGPLALKLKRWAS